MTERLAFGTTQAWLDFLTPTLHQIEAEYARYIERDLLGKIVFKNFAVNVLKVAPKDVRIPISRMGDNGTYKDSCDAGIRFQDRSYNVETKCSYQVVAKKTNPSPRWAFKRLRPQSNDYDLVFMVGINTPGLENSQGYWTHLNLLKKQHQANGRLFDLALLPHKPEFLNQCGIFVLPRASIQHVQVDVTIRALSKRPDFEFFSWGYDVPRLREVWLRAVQRFNASSSAGAISWQD